MDIYKNQGRDSGVIAYEIGQDYIKVQFHGGSIYLYDYKITGADNIEQMKKLATAGIGLNGFINKYVKYRYAAKLR